MHHWPAGAERDTPERQVQGFGCQRLLEQVMLTDRSATSSHENVCCELARAAHGGRYFPDAVPNDTEFVHFGPVKACKRPESKAVRKDNFALLGRAARWHQFVAG